MPVTKPLITLAKADALHTSKDAFCPEKIYYPGGKTMVYVLDVVKTLMIFNPDLLSLIHEIEADQDLDPGKELAS